MWAQFHEILGHVEIVERDHTPVSNYVFKVLGHTLMWDVDEIISHITTDFTLVFSYVRFLAVIEAEVEVCIRFNF